MRKYFTFIIFLTCIHIPLKAQLHDSDWIYVPPPEQSPTYAGMVSPEHILVVFNQGNSVSDSIAHYYAVERGIPEINIIRDFEGDQGLQIPDTAIYNGERVILFHNREIIKRDATCSDEGSDGYCDTLAWHYYNDTIAIPIARYLNNTYDQNSGQYLKDKIRYIVLCKGIPIKIQSGDPDYNWEGINVSVDALLTLLKTDSNNNPSILSLYLDSGISNPYSQIDPNLNFNHRFLPNHYVNGNWTLAYLVSRLDGQSKTDVIDAIDAQGDPDHTGTKAWIFDGDPTYPSHNTDILLARDSLLSLDYPIFYNTDTNPILSCSLDVIGYSSQGLHSASLDSGYYQLQLDFNYANGSITNTYESFSYYSNYPQYSRDDHGLVSEFIHKRSDNESGSCGLGHTWEPWESGIVINHIAYFAYGGGYNMVDAAYMGMLVLGSQNVVMGDPLMMIAWGKQTITSKTEMTDTNLVTDTLTITSGDTLDLKSGSYLRLRRHGFITGLGRLVVGSNVTISTDSWQRALLLAAENNHPKLIWGNINIITPITRYLIYRKYGSGSWSQITSTQSYNWVDTTVNFAALFGSSVQYKIKAINDSEESDYSNTVEASVTRAKENSGEIRNDFSYNLNQNYPNPFNPTTSISYEIAEECLVSLKIYDILGSEAVLLVNEVKQPGRYIVQFDASRLSSGVYIYQMKVNNFVSSRKMVIIK